MEIWGIEKSGGEGGIETPIGEWEVSVGMSLVFKALFPFERIASV
jgi:hypothetical protein